MQRKTTSNGKKGGMLKGKPHYDKQGNSVGGIKAVVTDAGGKPVELEGGEVIINKEASKKYWRELSKINQSAGNGVPIGPPDGMVDEDPDGEYSGGGKIEFNANKLPNKWILSYAKKIKRDHPEIWKLGGNIFGNEAFNNLSRVAERGYWLDSEEWMYKKWQSYVARHHKDYRIEGVVAMLKWVDKVDKGWPYMKQLIEDKIDKLSKKGWKHKTTKMKDGGPIDMSSKKFMQWYIDWYKAISDLMNITFSLPNELLPFKENNVVILDLFEKKKQDIDAKKYLHEIVKKADELGVVIYLEPKPRHKYFFKNEAKKKKITKEYLIDYYRNFGFEVTKDKEFMKRLPQMKDGGNLIKRADGTYSERGLWDNIRDNIGSGKKPTKQMLKEEAEIKSETKYHLGGDMSKHLAPNGKPSNLTHEQWHMVRTPEFKAWFGDWENSPENSSKVVDENGEPLVMYHGSPSDFTVFETDIIESDRDDRDFKPRFWFIVDKNWADNYSKSIPTPTQKTYEVFLNIRNPKYDFNLYVEDNNDGCIEVRGKKVWVAIATLSNQIKLADGTNTTFDANNTDIRYEKGGLIAPNGKPSKLTEEQYKLVRTPSFKQWFGDWENDPKNASQVVDENGEPLVVYRGDSSASKKGNIFKTGFNRMGFVSKSRLPNQYFHYFVNNYDVAMGYAENQVEDHNDKVQYTGKGKKWETKVTPYFLNIRNPIDITPNNPLFPTFKEYTESLKYQFGDSYEKTQSYNTGYKYGFGITSSALNKIFIDKLGEDYLSSHEWYDVRRYEKEQFERGHWDENVYSFFIEYKYDSAGGRSAILANLYASMKNQGVDGMVFLEATHWKDKGDFFGQYYKYTRGEIKQEPKFDYTRWVEKPKVYAALESNQIKLADGSNTTFDGSNPDIRFDEGGELAKGIKAEHEHSQTISKFKKPGVSDLQVETAIAKDHLKEDLNYYSKLQKMEAQKFDGGGLITNSGVVANIGDEGKLKTKKGIVDIKITNITEKWVIFNDLSDGGKRKDNPIDKFKENYQGSTGQTAQPQSTSSVFQTTLTKIIPALVTKEDDLQGKFLINITYQIVYYIRYITDNVGSYFLHVDIQASPDESTIGDNDVLKFTDDEIKSIMNGTNEDYLLFQSKPTTPVSSKSIDDRIKEYQALFDGNDIIKNLPPYLKELALSNQESFAGVRDENWGLGAAFNWEQSYEGSQFWAYVSEGRWKVEEVMKVVGSKEKLFELPQVKPTLASAPAPAQSIADIPSTDPTTWDAYFNTGDRVRVRYDFSKDLGNGLSEVNYNSPENSFVIKKIVTYESAKRPENPTGRVYWLDNNGQWEGKDLELIGASDGVSETTQTTSQGTKPKPQKFDPNLDYAALFNTYLQSNTETSKDVTSDLVNRQISVFKTIISQ